MSEFGSADQKPKKFYKAADLVKLEDGNFSVALDGRTLRTPAKSVLSLPTEALANVVAEEWHCQGDHIDVASMHLTRLVNVAVDRTPVARADMAEEVVRFAETDLVSHLAEGPTELRERQQAGWSPVRDWAAQARNVFLVPVEGIMAAPQPTQSLDAAREYALSLDDMRLTGLNFGLSLFGSAVLSLGVEGGFLAADQAYDLSRIDDDFQIEQWGEDEEAMHRVAFMRTQADALGCFYAALEAGQ